MRSKPDKRNEWIFSRSFAVIADKSAAKYSAIAHCRSVKIKLTLFHCLSIKIVDDVLKLARFSYADYKTAINVIDYLQNEIDYVPWKSAFNNFEFILERLNTDETLQFKVNQIKAEQKADIRMDMPRPCQNEPS